MPVYKDTPNNRKLNRVGQDWDDWKKKQSKSPPKKTKTLTGFVKGKKTKFKLPTDPEKLKKLQEEAKKLKSMTVAKPGQLKNLQAEIIKLKSMMETEGAAPPKVSKVSKKAQLKNMLTEGDIEIMINLFKFSEAEGGDDIKWNFNNITWDELEYAYSMGFYPMKLDEDDQAIDRPKLLQKKLRRFDKIILEKDKRNLTIKNLSKEDRDKLQKAIRENKK